MIGVFNRQEDSHHFQMDQGYHTATAEEPWIAMGMNLAWLAGSQKTTNWLWLGI